jgi:hypothetical protein
MMRRRGRVEGEKKGRINRRKGKWQEGEVHRKNMK